MFITLDTWTDRLTDRIGKTLSHSAHDKNETRNTVQK